MSKKGSMWAGIAAAASAVGAELQSREADKRKEKLYLMEQEIMQKRQEALASLRGDITDRNAENRAGRTLNRIEFQHALTAGDITGGYEDKETGTYYGRTKDHQMIPLHVTSDEFQAGLKAIQSGKVAEANLAPEKIQAQIDQSKAATANLGSEIARRDALPIPSSASDPSGDKIRADYQKQINAMRVQAIKQAAQDKKDGKPGVAFDENAAAEQVTPQLYSVYGTDAVKNALGGANNAPVAARPPAATPQQPTQQAPQPAQAPATDNKPSQQDLLDAATAAVKAGKNQKAVGERLQQLMVQYGYANDPQPTSFDNVDSGVSTLNAGNVGQ